MDQLDGVIEERSDLIAKTLILEQINLDLSAKLIQQAQEWSDKEFDLAEKLQTATFVSDIRNKYFKECIALLTQLEQEQSVPEKLTSIIKKKTAAIVQAKERTEHPHNGQFQLQSVMFERDNLQMELAESLKQIERLE